VALGDPKDVYAAYESALGTSLLASQLKKIESGIGLPVRAFEASPRRRPYPCRCRACHPASCGISLSCCELALANDSLLLALQRHHWLQTLSSH